MNNALISIKPEYVKLILSGEKTIEIRNRYVNLGPGTRLWIYSTLPEGCLEAVATIGFVDIDSPDVIWDRYHDQIGISQAAFRFYVNSSNEISAVYLQGVRKLKPSLSLNTLRSAMEGFHPPQFFKRIQSTKQLFNLLRQKEVKLACSRGLPIAKVMI